MQALIDSYTSLYALKFTIPTLDFIDTSQSPKTSMSSTIISLIERPSLNRRIHKLLEEFSTLEYNWDDEDALAPAPEALSQGELLTKILDNHSQLIFHAAPGPNGEVMLDLRSKDKTKSVEIIFYHNRSSIVYYPGEGNPFQEEFNFQALPDILVWLNGNV